MTATAKIDQITANNYDTSEHRAARLQAYHTDDPRRIFEQEIGHEIHDRSYMRFLNETIAELRKEGEHSGRRYATLMPIAAELMEYWYNNAPETKMYRDPTAEEMRRCLESHRPAAFWVRLLRMEHEAEKRAKGGSGS